MADGCPRGLTPIDLHIQQRPPRHLDSPAAGTTNNRRVAMSTHREKQAGTATFLCKAPGRYQGDARAYRLDPPLKAEVWSGDYESKTGVEHSHVIVSANVVYISGPETYIFPADPETLEISDWAELHGSFRGALDHERALNNAGYEVSA